MRHTKRSKKHAHRSFAGIPRVVMSHRDYICLPGSAVKLLLELARQYNGRNNGDLTVAHSLLKDRGFTSKDTIKRAKDALLHAGLIIQTRQGRFLNPGGVCDLFALSWQAIDECGKKLDIEPTIAPPRTFQANETCKTPGPVSGLGSSLKQVRQPSRNERGQYSSSLKQVRLTVGT